MTRRCSSLLLFPVLACLPVRAASAQTTSTGDVAVSYAFLRLTEGGDSLNVPAGWLVSVSRRVAPLLSMVGEAGGSYRSDEGDFQLHTFMGGVRVSAVRRTGTGPRPFAQFLAGTAVASCCGESTVVFAIEPGAGVDVPIGRRTAARLGVTFPLVYDDPYVGKLLRFQVGVVFGLGALPEGRG